MNLFYKFFTDFDPQKTLTSFLTLFAVMDILGSIAVIISMRKKVGYIHARKTAMVAGIIMITFLFIGQSILKIFSIDISSFSMAGSIILFFFGLEMILNINIFRIDADAESSSIVPLAFPIIAGTGVLSTLITLKAQYEGINVLLAILGNLTLVYIVLRYSEWIEKKLGKLIVSIIHKMMGILLLSIAIKVFITHMLLKLD